MKKKHEMVLNALWRLFLTLLLAVVLLNVGAMLIHERIRWSEASELCEAQRLQSRNVLLTDMCKHGPDTERFGEDGVRMCTRAQADVSIWPIACTARTYWRMSELFRLYSMYAESHWMLFGITSVVCAVCIQQLFSCLRQPSSPPLQHHHSPYGYLYPHHYPIVQSPMQNPQNPQNQQHQRHLSHSPSPPKLKRAKRMRESRGNDDYDDNDDDDDEQELMRQKYDALETRAFLEENYRQRAGTFEFNDAFSSDEEHYCYRE